MSMGCHYYDIRCRIAYVHVDSWLLHFDIFLWVMFAARYDWCGWRWNIGELMMAEIFHFHWWRWQLWFVFCTLSAQGFCVGRTSRRIVAERWKSYGTGRCTLIRCLGDFIFEHRCKERFSVREIVWIWKLKKKCPHFTLLYEYFYRVWQAISHMPASWLLLSLFSDESSMSFIWKKKESNRIINRSPLEYIR